MGHHAWAAGVGVVGLAAAILTGCVGRDDDDLGAARAPILGGAAAAGESPVIGIATLDGPQVCSGALLAPGLVITSQQCIGTVAATGPCAQAQFGPPRAPSRFFVTARTPMTMAAGDYHGVTEIRLPPGAPGFCGRDIALLRLTSLVAAIKADPLAPRLDTPVAAAETYAAIGFGGTDAAGAGFGQRRRLDGLAVDCVGAACGSPAIGAGEWRGAASVCPGDEGGPALVGDGRVVGVASRAGAGCTDSIYTSLAVHRDWLIAEAIRAATLGGYPPPAWTGAAPAIDAGVDAAIAIDASPGPDAGDPPAVADGGGCAASGGAASSPTAGLTLLAAVVAVTIAAACSRRRAGRPRRDRDRDRRRACAA